jgi:hypothetical protein
MKTLFANSTRVAALLLIFSSCAAGLARAQLLSEPPLPTKQQNDKKKAKPRPANLEWMWQYTPAPDQHGQEQGREHELIQDPNYRDFLEQYFTAPQSFWGSTTLDPRNTKRKSLADTVDDFLTVPGSVFADDNRYVTVTGHVFRYPSGRGLVFADLNSPHPLVAFAAIDWIRESHATTEPDAEYTLWIFVNQTPGTPQNPLSLPPPLLRSLTRWMAEPVAGSGIVQKITAAILVDPDGTPHQIPVPTSTATAPDEAKPLPKRKPN